MEEFSFEEWQARDQATRAAGNVRGRHFTTYADEVKQLKRSGDNLAAITLIYECIDAAEAQTRQETEDDIWRAEQATVPGSFARAMLEGGHAPTVLGGNVPPGWYEMAAVIHRKAGDREAEIAVLERYIAQTRRLHPDNKIATRLRKLLEKSQPPPAIEPA